MNLKATLESIQTKHFFRFNYLVNQYRDPVMRKLYEEFSLHRPEIAILYCLQSDDIVNAVDVARITRLPKNTLSRSAKLLEDRKLLRSKVDPDDRRKSILFLTPAGKKICDRVKAIYTEVEEELLSPLSAREIAQLDALLTKLCDYVDTRQSKVAARQGP